MVDSHHLPDTKSWQRDVACDRREVGATRAWVRRLLQPTVDVDVLERVELVLSELVTNAIVHAHTASVVRVVHGQHDVRIEVHDSGPGWPALMPTDPSRIGGVGLQVVDQLSSAWGVTPQPHGGKVVWASVESA
jgi:anti-sigma regulatory factor (Ser/Thr protein kinase)